MTGGTIDDVVAMVEFGVPEFGEAGGGKLGEGEVVGFWFLDAIAKVDHTEQGVVPQRVDFYRFTNTRGDDPVIYFGVHPGELFCFCSGVE